MKFLIVGDLHGKKPNIYFKNFDAIIAPGDFCSDAPRKYMFQALKKYMQNTNSRINWYDLTGKRKAKGMIKKSLADGRKVLEFLNSFNIPVYIVPGNWDWTKDDGQWNFIKKDHYKLLIKGLHSIMDVEHKLIDIGDYQIIGYGISSGPEYPQYSEDRNGIKPNTLKKIRLAYNLAYNKVASLFKIARKPVIYLSHNVPFNTPIDKITNKASPRNGLHFGSLISRKIIEKYQPLICIGGHMHEHFGKCKIGNTVAINAGYGGHVNVLVELSGNKIKKIEFHRSSR
jgi:Icc-related predicted phosphoesterase